MTIGQKIRKLRMLRDWSQYDLADYIGVFQPKVSDWENDVHQPTTERLSALAGLFGTTIDDIINEEVDV